MTEPPTEAGSSLDLQDPAPTILEGPGRYKVTEAPDGGWIIARTTGICENCRGCGCGEHAEPITVPGMIIKLVQARISAGASMNPLEMLKAMRR